MAAAPSRQELDEAIQSLLENIDHVGSSLLALLFQAYEGQPGRADSAMTYGKAMKDQVSDGWKRHGAGMAEVLGTTINLLVTVRNLLAAEPNGGEPTDGS